MAYRIRGLNPDDYSALYGLDDTALAQRGAARVQAVSKPGAPCRITLEDAEPGDAMLLINHVSHPVGPYRASHAIFIREGADDAGLFVDAIPPVFIPRILSLRGFDGAGMMIDARLSQPGEAETGILDLFANPAVAVIHAHNAIRGCFAATVERHP